ncbi:SOS response-associated peptidase [Methylobrevis pamukkalensis]|uniref:Abasic site processing protein n=1 Tax=Methylobrevis pamukkalensis TaxID=1439726 RepID=A0A1E3H3R4_9HYPH|nr:SOS response-associated peptidase [Methylobrevis pamukkalensis]ODN70952.1 putative SOS response-associated peptidase YedK [Methylobrevis pamukkalensis]
MCGRFILIAPPDEVRRAFGYVEQPNFPPRYNIAPTQPIAVVRFGRDGRHFHLMRWGLIPGWVTDTAKFPLLINARSETAVEKPAFRNAMRHRRCLIPASGFYEWRRVGNEKQPFLIRPRDGSLLAFAGLFELYADAAGNEIDTAAILTTSANRLMAPIHDRMPVVLAEKDFSAWLDTDRNEPRHVADLMRPAADDLLEAVPVSARVNAVRNDDVGLLEPLSEPMAIDPPVVMEKPAKAKRQGELF